MGGKIKIRLGGLHDVELFLRTVEKFASDVDLITERGVVDAKSALGVCKVDTNQKLYVQIISDNVDEIRKFDTAMEDFI